MSGGSKCYDEKLKQEKDQGDGVAILNGDRKQCLSDLSKDLKKVGKQSHAFSFPGQASSGSQPRLSWFISGPSLKGLQLVDPKTKHTLLLVWFNSPFF